MRAFGIVRPRKCEVIMIIDEIIELEYYLDCSKNTRVLLKKKKACAPKYYRRRNLFHCKGKGNRSCAKYERNGVAEQTEPEAAGVPVPQDQDPELRVPAQ